jgi:hypothetical protein
MLQANLSTSTDFSSEFNILFEDRETELPNTPEPEVIGYDEAVSGDISDDPANPLELPLTEGTTTLSATTEDGDQEYVTVTVPEGFQLDTLVLESFSNDNAAFIGVQEGDTFTEPLDESADAANLLGYALFGGRARTDEDILDDISSGRDTEGFRGALPSGAYTFALQQLNVDSSYTLAFNVSEVNPESESKRDFEWNYDERNYDFPDSFTGQDTASNRVIESLNIEDSNRTYDFEDELSIFGNNSYPIAEANSDSLLTISDFDSAIADKASAESFWNTNSEFSETIGMVGDFTSGEDFIGIAS